jgi:hypothetical protein
VRNSALHRHVERCAGQGIPFAPTPSIWAGGPLTCPFRPTSTPHLNPPPQLEEAEKARATAEGVSSIALDLHACLLVSMQRLRAAGRARPGKMRLPVPCERWRPCALLPPAPANARGQGVVGTGLVSEGTCCKGKVGACPPRACMPHRRGACVDGLRRGCSWPGPVLACVLSNSMVPPAVLVPVLQLRTQNERSSLFS